MSPLVLLTLLILLCVVFGKEKDIYHVITGESDVPYKKSLDPVFYVGVYDEKPKIIPKKVKNKLSIILAHIHNSQHVSSFIPFTYSTKLR